MSFSDRAKSLKSYGLRTLREYKVGVPNALVTDIASLNRFRVQTEYEYAHIG